MLQSTTANLKHLSAALGDEDLVKPYAKGGLCIRTGSYFQLGRGGGTSSSAALTGQRETVDCPACVRLTL